MSAERLPPMRYVKKGMMLKFIRQVQDGNVYLNKATGQSGREVYILEDDESFGDGLCLVAFKRPIRNVFGQPVEMHYINSGFKYCWIVRKELLINNCREV